MFGRLSPPASGAAKFDVTNKTPPASGSTASLREQEWLERYPELAKQWEASANEVSLDELTDNRYRPTPVVDVAAFKDSFPKGLPQAYIQSMEEGAAEGKAALAADMRQQKQSVLKAESQYLETSRLYRQFVVEILGEHPDNRPKFRIAPGQLNEEIENLRALQQSNDSEWTPNRNKPTVITFDGRQENMLIPERLDVLALMGQDVDVPLAMEEDPLDAGLLANLRGWKNFPPSPSGVCVDTMVSIEEAEDATGAHLRDAHISFTVERGCLASGGDLFHDKMTIEDAKVKCRQLPGCRGFTFKGTDASSTQPVMCFFKSHYHVTQSHQWTAVHALWTEHSDSIDELLSIALPAYMTKTEGSATEGAIEI